LESSIYEEFKKVIPLEGLELKHKILEFFYDVNSIWPEQGISVYDLMDNFNNPHDELREWTLNLSKAELLKQQMQGHVYRKNRGQVKANPFTINPSKFEDVEKILTNYKQKRSGPESQNSVPIKVFLSYSTRNKIAAGKIKDELEEYGLVVFLAHEKIEPSEKWRSKILSELKECHVFVAILTDYFRESLWCDQESGFAMAYDKKIISLKTKANPHGFLERFQAANLKKQDIPKTCKDITKSIAQDKTLSESFRNGLIERFGSSSSYSEAIATTNKLVRVDDFTKAQMNRIVEYVIKNNQLNESVGAFPELKRFIEDHKEQVDQNRYREFLQLLE